jgi:hypothetical protein
MTFKQSDDSFWVQHFISDETDRNVGNAQTKILEAIAHMETQIAATTARFEPSSSIADYARQARTANATSVTNNKKLQIAHHLYTVGVHLGV